MNAKNSGSDCSHIRLVLADDESLTHGAVDALLGLDPDLVVLGEAGTGDEVIASVRQHRPDVVVMDVVMPGLDGAEVSEWIVSNEPTTSCVILTRHARPRVLRRALMVRVAGFLTKSAPATVPAEVIRRIHGRGRYLDPDLAMTALMAEGCPLTELELDPPSRWRARLPTSRGGHTSHRGRCAITCRRRCRSSVPGRVGKRWSGCTTTRTAGRVGPRPERNPTSLKWEASRSEATGRSTWPPDF